MPSVSKIEQNWAVNLVPRSRMMDDGDQFLDCRAEPHAQLGERGFLGRGHLDPLGPFAAQDLVLGL
jgi:hypothetical protein